MPIIPMDDDLHRILDRPSPQIETEVIEMVRATLDRLQPLKPNIPLAMPQITYDLKGTTAGYANSKRIRLNLGMLFDPELHDDMINSTLPHEVCHYVERHFYGTSGHGRNWRYLMEYIGLAPERCHSYDVAQHKARHHSRPHLYVCPCGNEFHLTNNLHNKHQSGRYRICLKCKGRLEYVETSSDGEEGLTLSSVDDLHYRLICLDYLRNYASAPLTQHL